MFDMALFCPHFLLFEHPRVKWAGGVRVSVDIFECYYIITYNEK